MGFFTMWDPIYWIVILATMILSGGASLMVKGAFKKYSQVRASSGVTGAQAASRMLQAAGISGVEIQRVSGFLSDHYDPRTRVVRLSPEVYDGRSLASLGVACHEVGHAVQHAKKYAPLVWRNAVVPVAGIGSNIGFVLIIISLFLGGAQHVFGMAAGLLGIGLFGTIFVMQVVNLPVEFDATFRAKRMLPELGLISGPKEAEGVSKVLNAAALTYVAGAVSSLLMLLYWAHRLGFLGGRR